MGHAIVMLSPSQTDVANDPALENALALRTFLGYDDFAAGVAGKHLLEQICMHAAGDLTLDLNLWRFDLLQFPMWRQMATQECSDSKLIIFAISKPGNLPEHVRTWIQSWPKQSEFGQRALVCLLHSNQPAQFESSLEYLSQAAKKHGLEFFSSYGQSAEDCDYSPEKMHARAQTISSVLEGILHHGDEPRVW